MASIVPVTLLLVIALACAYGDDPFKSDAAKGPASPSDAIKVHDDPSGKAYFPNGREGWYTRILSKMKEPSLLAEASNGKAESYRFLCVPTFSRPLAIRVYKTDEGAWEIRTIRLSGKGGYDIGDIELQGTSALHEDEAIRHRNLVLAKGALVKLTDLQEHFFTGLDGEQWVLEAVIDGKYHMADLWSPLSFVDKKFDVGIEIPDFRPFVSACEHFLNLAEVSLPSRIPVDKKS